MRWNTRVVYAETTHAHVYMVQMGTHKEKARQLTDFHLDAFYARPDQGEQVAYIHFDEVIHHGRQQLIPEHVPFPAIGQPEHALQIAALDL